MRRMRHLKPREIQGCQLALDASIATSLYDATSGGSLVAADGAVARWEDQSNNGWHATQSSSGSRPLRIDRAVGGQTVARFDGADDIMTLGTKDVLRNVNSACVAFIGKRDTSASGFRVWFFISWTTSPAGVRFDFNSDGADCSAEGRRLDSDTAGQFTPVSDGNDPRAAVSVVNIDYTTGVAQWLRNGVLIGTQSPWGTAGAATSNTSSAQTALAGYPQDPTAYNWKGDLCEVVVWGQKLNDFQLRRFNDSRRAKWRIGTVT